MDDTAFKWFVEQIFTPRVRYVMTGCKTRVVVYLPPNRLRGGHYANVKREWRVCEIELDED